MSIVSEMFEKVVVDEAHEERCREIDMESLGG